MKLVIKDIKKNKSVSRVIPTNVLKNPATFANCKKKKKSFETGIFLDCLKETNASLIFKKSDPLVAKENYHLVRIL